MHMCIEGVLPSGLWVDVTVEAFNVHTLSKIFQLQHRNTYPDTQAHTHTHRRVEDTCHGLLNKPGRYKEKSESERKSGRKRGNVVRGEGWGSPNSRFLSLIHPLLCSSSSPCSHCLRSIENQF